MKLQTKFENIDETAVVPDEEKEPEGDLEDAENGSKGTEEIDDEENHTFDLHFYF